MRFTRFALATCATVGVVTAVAVAAAPIAQTEPASDIGSTTATLNGNLAPNGAPTSYYFQYGTSADYGAQTPTQGPVKGGATKNVSAALTGLQPGTTYHYRLVGTNADGTTTGKDATFTTAAAGSDEGAVTIAASRSIVPFRRPVAITGTVPGPQNANVTVTLEESRYPYTQGFRATDQSVATDASGQYRLVVLPEVNTRYRVVAKAKKRPTSGEVEVRVRVRVSLGVSDRTPSAGERVRFSGKVLPAHDGRRARIQRRTASGRWKTVARARLRAAKPTVNGTARSRFVKRVRVRNDGVYRVRVAPGDGDHLAGNSRRRSIDVG